MCSLTENKYFGSLHIGEHGKAKNWGCPDTVDSNGLRPLRPGLSVYSHSVNNKQVTLCYWLRSSPLCHAQQRFIQWPPSCGGPGVLTPSLSGGGVQMCTNPHFLLPCCYTWPVIH